MEVVVFIQGVKNLGHVLNGEGSRGNLDPQNSVINFAIPANLMAINSLL